MKRTTTSDIWNEFLQNSISKARGPNGAGDFVDPLSMDEVGLNCGVEIFWQVPPFRGERVHTAIFPFGDQRSITDIADVR